VNGYQILYIKSASLSKIISYSMSQTYRLTAGFAGNPETAA